MGDPKVTSILNATVMGIPGANSFRDAWFPILSEFDDVVLIPDNDDAGVELVKRVCSVNNTVRVGFLPLRHNDFCDAWRMTNITNCIDVITCASRVEVRLPRVINAGKFTVFSSFGKSENADSLKFIQFVNSATGPLKTCGNNEYKARCPFHEDVTPSFYVNTEKNTYYCHGCDAGGDAFDFVMRIEGCSFLDAKKVLAP